MLVQGQQQLTLERDEHSRGEHQSTFGFLENKRQNQHEKYNVRGLPDSCTIYRKWQWYEGGLKMF